MLTRSRLFLVPLIAGLALALAPPTVEAATVTYSAAGPTLAVPGTTAKVRVTVRASRKSRVAELTVCVRDVANGHHDFAHHKSVVLTTAGTVYTATKKLKPGRYKYAPCVKDSRGWHWVGVSKWFTVKPAARPGLRNLPGQSALTAYGSSSAAKAFARPGALIITGRDQYGAKPFRQAAVAGATVLIYLDPMIDASHGRYHQLLVHKSRCGPATSRWPGSPKANSYGHLQDFRVGSVLQRKLACVLELMVKENPHMGGFFADDVGSRSWYPGFSWQHWGTGNQQAYRSGAIALAQTFHDVAVEHGLMVMVNGTWGAGSLAASGGGYPTMSKPGLSLADGGYIEHHDTSELTYWSAYAKGQWGTAAGSISRGKPFMYVQAEDVATRKAYARTGVFAFLSAQRTYDRASVWRSSYATGLPTNVAR